MLLVQAWDNQGLAPAGWGSHIMVRWCDFEPTPGVYRLDLFTSAIERRERPCYVQLCFSLYDQTAGVPVDLTPRHHKHSLKIVVGRLVGEIPNYDAAWTEAYCRAVEALADGLRERPQVVGYWHAAGFNTETQAMQWAIRGCAWGAAVKPLLNQYAYYAFITESTKRALAAWGTVPVYLPGAPAPGTLWGTRKRDLIADLLRQGVGYLNCALLSDNDASIEVGVRAGLGMYDIAALTQQRGFEEGPRLNRADPLELYWMLLRARHWQAQFVNLYWTLSGNDYAAIVDLLPVDDARWIVFRGAEFPTVTFTAAGKIYGNGGEPGNWAQGITAAVTPTRAGVGFSFDRWVLDVAGLLILTLPGAADGDYTVTIWRPDGSRVVSICQVAGERLVLPAGRYHRVDVTAPPLTIEERVIKLEARVAVLEGRLGAADGTSLQAVRADVSRAGMPRLPSEDPRR
jgi:hypothetical protein